ncbi:MAG: hypothetical protein E7213_03560 [Clostridium sp.]|nr:hypothetical protein [Clostridium sp.]
MKIKKRVLAILCTLCFVFFFTSCGLDKTEKMTPQESGDMFYNIAAHQDDAKLKELLGDKASEVDEAIKNRNVETKESISSIFGEIELSNEEANNFVDSVLKAMGKLECKKVTVLNEDDDKVELEFEVTYVDYNKISEEITSELKTELQTKIANVGASNIDYNKLQNEAIKMTFLKFTEKLNSYVPSEDTRTFKYIFVKKTYNIDSKNKEIYVPEDEKGFAEQVAKVSLSA